MKKISIITPCFNASKYIEETIKSVIGNRAVINKAIELEYILCDAQSTDDTAVIIENTLAGIHQSNISFKLISESDSGMYDALAKGLQYATGDVSAYLNAGDIYSSYAFEIVFEIMNAYPVKWLTGLIVTYNEKSHIIDALLPYKFRNNFIQKGFYNLKLLPFIQQESTFWVSSLNDTIDYDKLSAFRYAGDFFIWKTFSKSEILFIVEAYLGGHKIHTDQLSAHKKSYYREMERIAMKRSFMENGTAYLDKIIWKMPSGIKKKMNKKTLFRFDHTFQRYSIPDKTLS